MLSIETASFRIEKTLIMNWAKWQNRLSYVFLHFWATLYSSVSTYTLSDTWEVGLNFFSPVISSLVFQSLALCIFTLFALLCVSLYIHRNTYRNARERELGKDIKSERLKDKRRYDGRKKMKNMFFRNVKYFFLYFCPPFLFLCLFSFLSNFKTNFSNFSFFSLPF